MEINQAFEADAEIEAYDKSGGGDAHQRKGPDALTAALGSTTPSIYYDCETDPLLQNRSDQEYGAARNSEDSSRKDPQRPPPGAWTGEADFAGRPWWRKPSVGSSEILWNKT